MKKTILIAVLAIFAVAFYTAHAQDVADGSLEFIETSLEEPPANGTNETHMNEELLLKEEVDKLNSSVSKALQGEKNLKKRGFIMRMFFGGDWDAAKKLRQETEENKNKIKEMEDRVRGCNTCSTNARNRLEEKLLALKEKNEKARISAIVERNSRGLFGWFKR